VRPVVLPPNGVPRFYLGGPGIAELRGTEPAGERVPEDWVGSTTTVFGEAELGLSRLPDGRLLRDAAAADPVAFFGPDHAERRGPDPALLVKLLDAGERLPVHVHPDGRFAREALGTPYGKTEAWIVIGTSKPDAAVAAGFREDVAPETLERWVRDQDHDAMLGALNPLPVQPGDAIFVPAGTPHAIGDGVLIVELQEPTDMSVLLEWDGFGIEDDDEATLGLGWERALRCVDRAALDPATLRGPDPAANGPVARLLPPAADRFFRAERLAPRSCAPAELAPGFAILVLTDGAGSLRPEHGEPLDLRRGDTVLVPWDAGAFALEGELVAIACRPPADGGEA
jgi:mannose-6-phosphate isomerase